MILFAIALFAVLIVAWLVAPSGAGEKAKAAVPALKLSESPAD
jgi:hypothetical protein